MIKNLAWFGISLLLGVSLFLSCGAKNEKRIWYQEKGLTPVIVIPDQVKGNEKKAATLFQQYFKQSTGTLLAVKKESTLLPSDTAMLVSIGNTRMAQHSNQNKPPIGHDAFATSFQRNQIIFYAPQNVNLLHAVAYFFERNLGASYMDAKDFQVNHQTSCAMAEYAEVGEGAFKYRQAYFPASLDYDYMNFHGLQHFEETWAVWGHQLNKILEASSTVPETVYALQGDKRNHNQFCFSNEALFTSLESGINTLYQKNEDLTYFNIAPNDNGIVCGCDQCMKINSGNKQASNSVATLLNRLAKRFPNLTFTSLAYATTLKPSTIKLAKNVVMILSTIEEAKGVPISTSANFVSLLKSWQSVCNRIYIWDYTVQYTNYNEVFPNLQALQQDLKYFKSVGVEGVFEHGSEEHYSLLGDFKSFVIAKWLWNPEANYDSLKTVFFQRAYPVSGDMLKQTLQSMESKQASKLKLDIYGNMRMSFGYLDAPMLTTLLQSVQESIASCSASESKRLKELQLSVMYDILESKRLIGYGSNGCFRRSGEDFVIEPELEEMLATLETSDRIYTETGERLDQYAGYWKSYIASEIGSNLAALKPVEITNPDDNHSGTSPKQALTDGVFGFHDYAAGYLVYNNRMMQLDLQASDFPEASSIKVSFLQSPRHHLFYPSSFECVGLDKQGRETVIVSKNVIQPDPEETGKQVLLMPVNMSAFKHIRIRIYPASSELIIDGSNKLPGIACDELIIQ